MKVSDVILDLLRTYGSKGTTVQEIVATGELFGFTKNSTRVNLTRLVSRKKIESRQRGHYRLRLESDPINEFAESWRLGEARVKPWSQSDWLCVHLNAHCQKSQWVLTNYGFKQVADQFWIRPDNLAVLAEQLVADLRRLGLAPSAVLIEQAKLTEGLSAQWIDHFDLKQIQTQYLTVNTELTTSLTRLMSLTESEAKKECFQLGGKGIEVLAKDPLIPEHYLASQQRQALWQTMIHYDQVGRGIWASQSQQVPDRLLVSTSQYTSVII